jgi:hypothetical protein
MQVKHCHHNGPGFLNASVNQWIKRTASSTETNADMAKAIA